MHLGGRQRELLVLQQLVLHLRHLPTQLGPDWRLLRPMGPREHLQQEPLPLQQPGLQLGLEPQELGFLAATFREMHVPILR